MPLKPGAPAPAFEAVDQNGETVRSSDLTGQRFVLYFYPHDDTPVCTREACGFEDARPAFDALEVPILGVSANSTRSHQRFAEKNQIGFRLLADPERKLVKAYDADGLFGRISRVTYIVGPDGTIEDVRKAELSGRGHAEWARERVQALEGSATAR